MRPMRVACVLLLAAFLFAGDLFAVHYLTHHRYRYIIIHHTASEVDDYASIKSYHRRHLHIRDAAYHLILSNGSKQVPFGFLEATSRYRHLSYALACRSVFYNSTAVHLCLVGNFEKHPPSRQEATAAGSAVDLLCRRYHIPYSHILLHRQVNATKCPGRTITREDVVHWARDLAGRCPKRIRDQQRRVIDRCSVSLLSLRRRWILALVLGHVGILGVMLVCAWLG